MELNSHHSGKLRFCLQGVDFSFFLFYIINSLSSISTWLSILPGPHLPLYREGLLFNSKKRKPIIWCNHTNWLKSIKYNHLAVTNTTSIFQHFCLVSWTGWSVESWTLPRTFPVLLAPSREFYPLDCFLSNPKHCILDNKQRLDQSG